MERLLLLYLLTPPFCFIFYCSGHSQFFFPSRRTSLCPGFVRQTKVIRPHLRLSRRRALSTERGGVVLVPEGCSSTAEPEELWRGCYVNALKSHGVSIFSFFFSALSENYWHMSLIYPDSLTANSPREEVAGKTRGEGMGGGACVTRSVGGVWGVVLPRLGLPTNQPAGEERGEHGRSDNNLFLFLHRKTCGSVGFQPHVNPPSVVLLSSFTTICPS